MLQRTPALSGGQADGCCWARAGRVAQPRPISLCLAGFVLCFRRPSFSCMLPAQFWANGFLFSSIFPLSPPTPDTGGIKQGREVCSHVSALSVSPVAHPGPHCSWKAPLSWPLLCEGPSPLKTWGEFAENGMPFSQAVTGASRDDARCGFWHPGHLSPPWPT